MQLKSPFQISSRLLPSLKIADGTISLECIGTTRDNRDQFQWYIDIPAGEFSADDMNSGAGGCSLQSAFGTLLSFLEACGEAYQYEMSGRKSENIDLFPPEVAEWAYCNSDEIGMLRMEIEDSESELIED